MPIIHDQEFGKITIRRSPRATQVRMRVSADGTLRASLPPYAPLFLVKRLLKSSRNELRTLIAKSRPAVTYMNGTKIGKSHVLVVEESNNAESTVARKGQKIIVTLAYGTNINDALIVKQIRTKIIEALKIEAKSYLPRRLEFLARQHGFTYEKTRFSTASGRWGSYSDHGTVSLNVALMNLPFELIDYVLIHELAHTKQMNHSQNFWKLVMMADPDYKLHRRIMKTKNPSL